MAYDQWSITMDKDIEKLHAETAISRCLQEPLEVDDRAVLVKQLRNCESWAELASINYRNAQIRLAKGRKQHLLPTKFKGMTELDRTVGIEAATAEIQGLVDLYGDQLEILRNRIKLGSLILRYGAKA
jgi:hypothetical protein